MSPAIKFYYIYSISKFFHYPRIFSFGAPVAIYRATFPAAQGGARCALPHFPNTSPESIGSRCDSASGAAAKIDPYICCAAWPRTKWVKSAIVSSIAVIFFDICDTNGSQKAKPGQKSGHVKAALESRQKRQQPQETAPQETHFALQTAESGHLQTQ